mmetsp:Transcript_80191/g.151499  ORF Transcript_80191/g.151499 Transcript_80191/m.151499 type:complete len:290 (+) Transcript_80191:3-872(+)
MTVSGACSSSSVNGVYTHAGITQTGAPYYQHSSNKWFVFYDPDCNGYGTKARWIFDVNQPSLTAAYDLDGDADCHYFGRKEVEQSSQLPLGTSTWKMVCDRQWSDVQLTLMQGAVEESKILTSTWAIVIYAVVAVLLTILSACVAWKCLRRRSHKSKSHDEPPATTSAPRTPTLLTSRREASFNEKPKDLETGKSRSQAPVKAKSDVKSVGVLSEWKSEVQSIGMLSEFCEPKEVDLDDLSNAGIFKESTTVDLDELPFTGILPRPQYTTSDLDDLILSFPEDDHDSLV